MSSGTPAQEGVPGGGPRRDKPSRPVPSGAFVATSLETEDLVPLTATNGLGLYDGGNTMPPTHRAVAPAVGPIAGTVGVVALGMSNTMREWASFAALAKNSCSLKPTLTLANGALEGVSMRDWAAPHGRAWEMAKNRIRRNGLDPISVQIAWVKMGSKAHHLSNRTAVERVQQERRWLKTILEQASEHFPNLRQVFMTSRSYAGYSQTPEHHEPVTGFDNGLAVRGVVADSIGGLTAVWTAWGPYLWANGRSVRIDGHNWEPVDFTADGVHPADPGARKVGRLLMRFFQGEPLTACWFEPR